MPSQQRELSILLPYTSHGRTRARRSFPTLCSFHKILFPSSSRHLFFHSPSFVLMRSVPLLLHPARLSIQESDIFHVIFQHKKQFHIHRFPHPVLQKTSASADKIHLPDCTVRSALRWYPAPRVCQFPQPWEEFQFFWIFLFQGAPWSALSTNYPRKESIPPAR